MAALLDEFIEWMRVSNAAAYTVYHRRACIAGFIRWAYEHGIEDPMEVTRRCCKTTSGISTTIAEERRAADVPHAVQPHGSRALVVPLAGAEQSHPAQPGRGPGHAQDRAAATARRAERIRGERVMLQPDIGEPLACVTAPSWRRSTLPESAAPS